MHGPRKKWGGILFPTRRDLSRQPLNDQNSGSPVRMGLANTFPTRGIRKDVIGFSSNLLQFVVPECVDRTLLMTEFGIAVNLFIWVHNSGGAT